jgi:nitric oxide reductase subunit B
VLAGTIFLAGGIIGTLHHLYFQRHADLRAGARLRVQRARSRAAALRRLRGVENLRSRAATPGSRSTAGRSTSSSPSPSGTWSGAGLFGFMINPPIALYYMQGLNTTPGARPRRAVRV